MQDTAHSAMQRLRANDSGLRRRTLLATTVGSIAGLALDSPHAQALPLPLPLASRPGSAAWLDEQFRNRPHENDLAAFRLKIEAAISAEVDPTRCMAMLNTMTADLLQRVSALAKPAHRLSALRAFLYTTGAWNGYRPIRYDLTTALDNDARHGFLHKLLTMRQGNCISMPLLFVALANRLTLATTLAQAPNHVFVVYTDPADGKDVQLEATSGAHPIRLESMRRAMPMTDQAITEGIYMRKLAHHECMALLAMPLLQRALRSRKDRLAIQLADVVLQHVPRSVDAMLVKGSALAVRMEQTFERKYLNPASMPSDVRAAYEQAHRHNLHWFQRAEALGWRDPDPQAEERYRQHIQRLMTIDAAGTKP